MSLVTKRDSIRHLLNQSDPGDAQAVYYAFYHPDDKTRIFTYPENSGRAQGYFALSRTGMDLFRPLLTLRIPSEDVQVGFDLINTAVPAGTAVILFSPESYMPLLRALFNFSSETVYRLLVLDSNQFEPIINVLVTQSSSPNGLPRFLIRSSAQGNEVTASAGLNWQTPNFAEVSVQTESEYRRQGWGRSVLAALVSNVLANGRKPLYLVENDNHASINLATSVGFADTGLRQILIQAVRKSST